MEKEFGLLNILGYFFFILMLFISVNILIVMNEIFYATALASVGLIGSSVYAIYLAKKYYNPSKR